MRRAPAQAGALSRVSIGPLTALLPAQEHSVSVTKTARVSGYRQFIVHCTIFR
jgi:hypothetical protein